MLGAQRVRLAALPLQVYPVHYAAFPTCARTLDRRPCAALALQAAGSLWLNAMHLWHLHGIHSWQPRQSMAALDFNYRKVFLKWDLIVEHAETHSTGELFMTGCLQAHACAARLPGRTAGGWATSPSRHLARAPRLTRAARWQPWRRTACLATSWTCAATAAAWSLPVRCTTQNCFPVYFLSPAARAVILHEHLGQLDSQASGSPRGPPTTALAR